MEIEEKRCDSMFERSRKIEGENYLRSNEVVVVNRRKF